MCGRVIQSSGPLPLAIVDGLSVGSRNVPPRYNAAPSQELLIIRQNHKTGERSHMVQWGLIPYWCTDPKGASAICRMKTDKLDRLVAAGIIKEIDRERVRFIVRRIVRPPERPDCPLPNNVV